MKLLTIIVAIATLAFSAKGQNCTCENNFEWLKKTFEGNDAGFQYIIDKKGQAAYNIHNQLMFEKTKSAKTLSDCVELLDEWLAFFRSGHIGIQRLINEPSPSQNNISQAAQKTEIWKGSISQFEKYISTKKEVGYEGIWQIGGYKIGIQKEGTSYIGFIIESDVDGWREPGLIKLKIEQDNNKIKSTFYMRDYSPTRSGEPELIGHNYLQIGSSLLKRLSPVFPDEPMVEDYFKSISSRKPYLEELNKTTLYLRIPSFDHREKFDIDSVIATNKTKILKTENLIIDIRNGTGGSDQSYYELLPIFYTNPIRNVGVEFYSTELNNQRFMDFATKPEYAPYFDEDQRQGFKRTFEMMQNKLGEFVSLSDEPVWITKFDIIHEFPKNVAIIINEGNGSTDEQFLLAAKQSKKVKLFGTTTLGTLDISNMHQVESPCGEFLLWYGLSRSMRIPGMTIDDIGLQPDFYLDKTIPKYKWVELVNEILNQ